EFFLIGLSIPVCVGVLVHHILIGFHGEDGIGAKWEHKAWEYQAVEKNSTGLIDAIIVLVFPPGDATDRAKLIAGVDILHISTEFEDVHPAVSVKLDGGGFDDPGFGEDGLHFIARLQDKRGEFFSGRHGYHRWSGAEIYSFPSRSGGVGFFGDRDGGKGGIGSGRIQLVSRFLRLLGWILLAGNHPST